MEGGHFLTRRHGLREISRVVPVIRCGGGRGQLSSGCMCTKVAKVVVVHKAGALVATTFARDTSTRARLAPDWHGTPRARAHTLALATRTHTHSPTRLLAKADAGLYAKADAGL